MKSPLNQWWTLIRNEVDQDRFDANHIVLHEY